MIRRTLLVLAVLELLRLVLVACCRAAFLAGFIAGYVRKTEPNTEPKELHP